MKMKRIAAALALIGAGSAALTPVQAQQKTERVEVTGSAIPRASAEGALPVTVISREDIERTGATTAEQLVAMIPSNFGGSVGSQNIGYTGGASTANLRGLGEKYTLVLLNGRRVADFGFGNAVIDLNSIPLAAVERVEVLMDGASAIYGADAVAGVINFILKRDFKGLELSAYQTHVDQGGGNVKNASLLAGFGDLDKDRFNVLFSLYSEKGQRLTAQKRKFASTGVRDDLFGPGNGIVSSRNGIPNLNFTDSRGNEYSQVNPLKHSGCNFEEAALVDLGDPTRCFTNYVHFIDIIPRQDHDNAVLRGTFKLNDNTQVYAEALKTKDHAVSFYSPAPVTNFGFAYPQSGRFYPTKITLPKGMTLPAGYVMPNGTVLAADTVLQANMDVTPVGAIGGRWRTTAGGGRSDVTDNESTRVVLGLKGSLGNWDYDTAYTSARFSGMVSFGPGQYSAALLEPIIAAGLVNVFGAQDEQSLAALESARVFGPENWSLSKSQTLDFKASTEIAQLAAGPLALALGGSFRKEELSQQSGPAKLIGDDVGGDGPIPGVVGDRKVTSFFGEASIPLAKGLEAQLAARYDKYKNSFGVNFDNWSPKLGLRYQPSNELLVRGSLGKGFRAPTLYENLRPFTENGATGGSFSDPIRCPNGNPINNSVGELQDECNIQQPTATQGTQDLKPEKSKQFSLGVVFSPSRNLSASIDYWDVTINDAIVQFSEDSVFENPAAYGDYIYRFDPADYPDGYTFDCGLNECGNLHPGSTNPNFPIAFVYLPRVNAAKFYGAGFDLAADYKFQMNGIGQLGVSGDATYYTKHGYKLEGQSSVSDVGVYKAFGVTPRWRHALTFSLKRGDWNGSLTNNYTGSYRDYTDFSLVGEGYPEKRTVKAYSTWDLRAGYSGFKNIELAFGIKNLLDTDPPGTRVAQYFQVGYDPKFADPRGRTFYLSAKLKVF